jgi:hypothetical protein
MNRLRSWIAIAASVLALLCLRPAGGQVLDHIEAFGGRLQVGDPAVLSTWEGGTEGPKGIAVGDLDGANGPDFAVSNLDGTVTVFLNRGDGTFSGPTHLATGMSTLREVILADLTPDEGTLESMPDIAACALGDGVVVVLPNQGGGTFGPPFTIPTWPFARNLAAGDFDGDGIPELVVAGSGVGLRLYHQVCRPDECRYESFRDYGQLFPTEGGFSKPVFSLEVFRPLGSFRDELAVTNADDNLAWVLAMGPTCEFETFKDVEWVVDAYDLEVGPVTSPAGGRPDIVTVQRDLGTVQIRRGMDGPDRFEDDVYQELSIPGGPRAAQIADLDGDGWNDLVVVLRNMDRVLICRNEVRQDGSRFLAIGSEMPVGRSPRDIVVADFNGDGQQDAAAINRVSEDVSLLTAYPGEVEFSALDQLYYSEPEVADIAVVNLNGTDDDGATRDDVIELVRTSGVARVRLAGPEGVLGYPASYLMGILPTALRVADVGGPGGHPDGIPDLVAACLGREGTEAGSLTVRLGDGKGEFGFELSAAPPPEAAGRLYSVEVADLDGDGLPDLAATYFDSRIGFFRGSGDGKFRFAAAHPFVYEAKLLAVDIDRDGRADILAGAGWGGELAAIGIGPGLLLPSPPPPMNVYPPPRPGLGTGDLKAADLDGRPGIDALIFGSETEVLAYRAAGGLEFVLASDILPPAGPLKASSIAIAELNGDGVKDLALGRDDDSSVDILLGQQGPGGGTTFVQGPSYDVFAGRLLATGDLDGDGKADLLGTGEALWTALSGRAPGIAPSLPPVLDPWMIPRVVINELLAMNRKYPVGPPPERKKWDWLEIFNGSPEPVDLNGYVLLREQEGEPPHVFQFTPATLRGQTFLESGKYLLLLCTTQDPWISPGHTGFKLPAEGGVLHLLDAAGNEVDRVEYPAQYQDISYGRYRDGHGNFAFNLNPSPAMPNFYNGAVEPKLRLDAVVPWDSTPLDPIETPRRGEDVRFFVSASDDVGIMSVRLFYGPAGTPPWEREWISLYDDGEHGDGGVRDGIFSNTLEYEKLFPPGGGSCVEPEVEGADGEVVEKPGPDLEPYCLTLDSIVPGLEITEIMTENHTTLEDESGQFPDWVEIRNPNDFPLPLAGYCLGERWPASDEWYRFPEDRILDPGERLVVFCDRDPEQSRYHTLFGLNKDLGGHLFLLATVPIGQVKAYKPVDSVDYPRDAKADVSWAKSESGWGVAPPTPGDENPSSAAAIYGDANRDGRVDLADALKIVFHLFFGDPEICRGAADVQPPQGLDISDAIFLLSHLFRGREPPPPGAVLCE